MKTRFSFKRLATVTVCYVTSVPGLIFWAGYALAILDNSRTNRTIEKALLSVLIAYAWFCHARVSIAWINQSRAARVWVRSGAITMIASFLFLPVIAIVTQPESAEGSILFLFMGLAATFPALILGVVLVFSHADSPAKETVPGANG